jgi:hypothetical protein
MKTQIPQIILNQIDRAANKNRQLGRVKLGNSVNLNFADKEDAAATTQVEIDVDWKKRYYLYDRGNFFPLDIYQFNNYFGKIYRTTVNGPKGNFIDYLDEPFVNAHYSTDVYVAQDVNVNVTMSLTYGSLSIYVNQVRAMTSPEESNYITSSYSLALKQGWNTIDLFVYHKNSNGILAVTGNLGSRVSTWRAPDFTPPNIPEWDTVPVESNYVDPTNSPAIHNILRWKNEKYTNPYTALRGWGVYKRSIEIAKDETNANILVISGWGTKGFTVSGDRRPYFPSDMQLMLGFAGPTLATVSGTKYESIIDQTVVTVKGTNYDYQNTLGRNYFIRRYMYKHLFDVEWDSSVSLVVSGLDTKIQQGEGAYYALDAYDDSVNKNRSDKSTVQGIHSGDHTPPGKLTSADIIGTVGGFKRISCIFKKPELWANYSPDVRGVRVWLTENPDPENNDDMMVAELPLIVTGTTSTVTISNTIDAGLAVDLADVTSYTFYLSTYDWYGNSNLWGLPSITGKTKVKVNTSTTDDVIEIDSDTNTIKIYADL